MCRSTQSIIGGVVSVTIKKIATLSGVSRGTVDRVLHNRGRVNEETASKVMLCARELGYEPNRVAKALATRKKNNLVAVIICTGQNPFFDEVLNGIQEMEKEFRHYGISVVIKRLDTLDATAQCAAIEKLCEEMTGLIITPIDHPKVKKILNSLTIPIVNLNTDIEGTKRIAYVGTDYRRGGRLAGGMVNIIKPSGANIGIVGGSKKLYGHRLREEGFLSELSTQQYKIKPTVYCEDDDILAFEVTSELIKSDDIDLLFIAAGGVNGACRAIAAQKKTLSVICFDATRLSVELIKSGVVTATICQNPTLQGEKAMMIMLDFLVLGHAPESGEYILEHEIKIKQSF